ncbi:MAG: hypothetical protein P1S60_07590 [Anaerolineae bacterium]|nr:hypothetical protein [Anaerolineae bacterium]
MVTDIVRICREAARRVCAHPRPWILRYLLELILAMLMTTAIMLPLMSNFTNPTIIRVLDSRQVDVLLDAMLHLDESSTNLVLPFIIVIIAGVVWLPLQVTGIWLEGGSFVSYTLDKKLSWQEFIKSCSRWFGKMLIIRALSFLIISGALAGIVPLIVMVRRLWHPLPWIVGGCGLLLIVAISMLAEYLRAAVVVHSAMHFRDAVRRGFQQLRDQALALTGFLFLALSGMALLLIIKRWITLSMPVSWWLLNLLFLQLVTLGRHGLRLFRLAGEITFIQFGGADNLMPLNPSMNPPVPQVESQTAVSSTGPADPD